MTGRGSSRGRTASGQWVVEGHTWSGVGWEGVGRGPVNCYTRAGLPEEPEPGIFRAANARYRLRDMDRDGVDVELVNGPYEQISQIKDPSCAPPACAPSTTGRANCTRSRNGRFVMLLPLPCMSPEEATAELLRVAEFGMPTGVISTGFSPRAGDAPDVGAGLGRRRRDRDAGQLHAYPSGGTRQIGVGVPGSNLATSP